MLPSSVEPLASKVTGCPTSTGLGVATMVGAGGVVAATLSVVVDSPWAPSASVTRSVTVWLPGWSR